MQLHGELRILCLQLVLQHWSSSYLHQICTGKSFQATAVDNWSAMSKVWKILSVCSSKIWQNLLHRRIYQKYRNCNWFIFDIPLCSIWCINSMDFRFCFMFTGYYLACDLLFDEKSYSWWPFAKTFRSSTIKWGFFCFFLFCSNQLQLSLSTCSCTVSSTQKKTKVST